MFDRKSLINAAKAVLSQREEILSAGKTIGDVLGNILEDTLTVYEELQQADKGIVTRSMLNPSQLAILGEYYKAVE